LIICAIEKHPDSDVRDSLTHTLFNLIKRPDGEQRRIIMDVCSYECIHFLIILFFFLVLIPVFLVMCLQACVELAKSIGEMRTETELLPQCWEQVFYIFGRCSGFL
jgi:hypothetical protein